MRVLLIDFDMDSAAAAESMALAQSFTLSSAIENSALLCLRHSALACLSTENNLAENKITVHAVYRFLPNLYLAMQTVRKHLVAGGFTVVHALGYRAACVALLARRYCPLEFTDTRLLLTIRDVPEALPSATLWRKDPMSLKHIGNKRVCEHADTIYCHTTRQEGRLLAARIESTRIHVISPGHDVTVKLNNEIHNNLVAPQTLDKPKRNKKHATKPLHTQAATTEPRCVFLALETLDNTPALERLLEAMKHLQHMKKRQAPASLPNVSPHNLSTWEVRIVGSGSTFAVLLARAKELGVDVQLALLGEQEHAQQLRYCHVLINARQDYGRCRRMLEVRAQGIPVIDINDEVSSEGGKLSVAPNDAQALANTMYLCLSQTFRHDLATAGVAYSNQHHYTQQAAQLVQRLASRHDTLHNQ